MANYDTESGCCGKTLPDMNRIRVRSRNNEKVIPAKRAMTSRLALCGYGSSIFERCNFHSYRKKADSDLRNPNRLTLLKSGYERLHSVTTKETNLMDILSQLAISIKNPITQPPGKRLRHRKPQTLSAASGAGSLILSSAGYRKHYREEHLTEKQKPAGQGRLFNLVANFPRTLRKRITNNAKYTTK
jgi:hypothetical protein